jgi:hypothetical protein
MMSPTPTPEEVLSGNPLVEAMARAYADIHLHLGDVALQDLMERVMPAALGLPQRYSPTQVMGHYGWNERQFNEALDMLGVAMLNALRASDTFDELKAVLDSADPDGTFVFTNTLGQKLSMKLPNYDAYLAARRGR